MKTSAARSEEVVSHRVQFLRGEPVHRSERPYVPQGSLRKVFKCRASEVLVEGPAGTGKSRALLELVNLRAIKYPNSRHLLLRKTRASLTESVLVTYEDKVLPEGSPIAQGIRRIHRSSYHYPNGSTLVVGGLDRPERTFSTEYDTITVFEATECDENDWQLLFRALRNNQMGWGHQAIADCNPGPPTHWLNRRADGVQMARIKTGHKDNPMLWSAKGKEWTQVGRQYIATLDRLTGVRLQRLRYGKWVAAEGVVYESWNPDIHLIDPFEIPQDWKRIRSIDFGYTNAFVCQWWAVDGDGRMYLYREMYRSKRLVEDHTRRILALDYDDHVKGVGFLTIADHDAEDRATMQRHGIQTIPAIKDVSPGIQAVQDRLRVAGDGKPRLFVFRDALLEKDRDLDEQKMPCCTQEEFDCYMWEEQREGKNVKEVPQKVHDHGMDAMRYAAMYLEQYNQPLQINRIRSKIMPVDTLYGFDRKRSSQDGLPWRSQPSTT